MLALYGVIILFFTIPVLWVSFLDLAKKGDLNDARWFEVYAQWPYWAGFLVFLLAQAALLDVRVDISEKRPSRKRTIIPLVIFSALLTALLVLGASLAIVETVTRDPFPEGWVIWLISLLFGVSWLIWGVVFYLWSRQLKPESLLDRIRRTVFRGSILELLVAVPTHVIARYRDYCCAGISTFMGIAFGLAVMLCSFGPGVLFLFFERWQALHRGNRNMVKGDIL